jgi:hypothetical protein
MKVVGHGRCSTAEQAAHGVSKAMAHMAVVFAGLERDFIRSRTREALAVRRDQGVVLGRPRSTPVDVVARHYATSLRTHEGQHAGESHPSRSTAATTAPTRSAHSCQHSC